MSNPCSKIQSNLKFSLLLLTMLLLVPEISIAVESPLKSFSAEYRTYKGKAHVGETELSLQRSGDFWRWRMSTEASGIYALLSNKSPYSETTFVISESGHQIHNILITDSKDKKKFETARFDWERGEVEVLRKKKQSQLVLAAKVYDFHSIHLLAATMIQHRQKSQQVDFYRKGKLVKSRFVHSGKGSIEMNGTKYRINVFELNIVGSKTSLKYYYDAENPILPLRIESSKPGEKPTIMLMRQVNWHL